MDPISKILQDEGDFLLDIHLKMSKQMEPTEIHPNVSLLNI